jgi:hypothetical protein
VFAYSGRGGNSARNTRDLGWLPAGNDVGINHAASRKGVPPKPPVPSPTSVAEAGGL